MSQEEERDAEARALPHAKVQRQLPTVVNVEWQVLQIGFECLKIVFDFMNLTLCMGLPFRQRHQCRDDHVLPFLAQK